MLQSKIIKIYRIDGEVNSTIIETSTGFYRITGDGFYEVNKDFLKGHKVFKVLDESGFIIKEVRSSMEHTVLKLSNGDFIIHHIANHSFSAESLLPAKSIVGLCGFSNIKINL